MDNHETAHWAELARQARVVLDPSEQLLRRILTPRQLQILRLVADGHTNAAIAEKLGITTNSVVNHLGAVYLALDIPADANSRVQATLDYLTSTGQLKNKG